MSASSLRERVTGAMWGLLVGDALGVPYEFTPRDAVPPCEQLEFEPPAGFRRAHSDTPPGTWSDDGAQALCLLASLLHCDRLEPDDLGRRLVNWYEWGYLAVDGRVFDVGVQTAQAIRAFQSGTPALEAGPSGELGNGNGALMRVLPLALWHRGNDADLARDAALQSRVTHGHLRSQLCCSLYCVWVRRTLEGHPTPWQASVELLRSMHAEGTLERWELDERIRPDDAACGTGSGYVVDCLRSARWAAAQGGYEAAVRAAISLGNDTDTTACVTGGLVGARDGLASIPPRWLASLRGRDEAAPLIERLASR